MSAPVDVLAVMKEAAEDVVSGDVGLRLLAAAEAVAELIAAARFYAEPTGDKSGAEWVKANARLRAALAGVGGAA